LSVLHSSWWQQTKNQVQEEKVFKKIIKQTNVVLVDQRPQNGQFV
jgi:hypothetical protein